MRTFCQIRACVHNSNIPSRRNKSAKPRCTKASVHLDQNGMCLDKLIKPRYRTRPPITFKATPREPVVIEGLFK